MRGQDEAISLLRYVADTDRVDDTCNQLADSCSFCQVSLNLQDRLGLAKIRYEQRYLKQSHIADRTPSRSGTVQDVASKSDISPADAGATEIVHKSFSSPMNKDSFSDPFYTQQGRLPPLMESVALEEMDATAASAAMDPEGVDEGRRRGPFLYSDPFRHSKEAPMPNPWTHKWALSAAQQMTLPFSSPTEHRFMRRHQTYPGSGRRWTHDHTDEFHDRRVMMEKHDPMLPSVPAFGVDGDRRPSSISVDYSMSPRTPPPKRQRTVPVRPGKLPAAGEFYNQHDPLRPEENGADLLLYLANSPQGSSSSSSGFPYAKHTHAPYIHSFNAYASSTAGMPYPSSEVPSTPPSRRNGGYPPSSSLYSTPMHSSTIPTTPLSRLTNNCGNNNNYNINNSSSNNNNLNTPFNFADYVNVTPSPAQPQERNAAGAGQGPTSAPQPQQLSIRSAKFMSPDNKIGMMVRGGGGGGDEGDEEAGDTTPSRTFRRKDVLTPGPPLVAIGDRETVKPEGLALFKQVGIELKRVGSSDSAGTISAGEGLDYDVFTQP